MNSSACRIAEDRLTPAHVVMQRLINAPAADCLALSLLSNAVLIWNTVQMTCIVAQLRAAGQQIEDTDLARVSPLAHAHVIPSGSYFQSPRRRAELTPEPVMA